VKGKSWLCLYIGGNVPPTSEPQSGPGGLRRRGGNFAASAFMNHQPGGVQQQQTIQQYYHPRDAQTRYQNATQVESTIVEVCSVKRKQET
jgi:hypothetical protein